MTTYFDFAPVQGNPYQFQPTLDGQLCTCVVNWSLFGQRWMLNILDVQGSLIVAKALIASHSGYNVQNITWDHNRVTITTDSRHDYHPTATFPLYFRNCLPDIYNGEFLCYIPDEYTIQYDAPLFPGTVLQYGQVSHDVDLIDGYFATSTMIFRDGSQQFEVTP